jgi:3-phosphoshikimate 1-carboxyvinyltransferase
MAKAPKNKAIIQSKNDVLFANIELPASKSISNRALILNAVLKQKFGKEIKLINLSEADDTKILLAALAQAEGTINVENAGTCLRFLCAYYAAIPGIKVVLTGNERLIERPILPLIKALQSLGANIQFLEKENFLPIAIEGRQLSGGKLVLEGNQSSQFISALLLISPLLEDPLEIQISGVIVSKDYIKLTQVMLQEFGFNCQISDDYTLVQTKAINKLKPLEEYKIEADWSSAAFFYEAAVLADKADIFFENLNLNSIQGDVILAEWMERFGIKSIQKETGVAITKTKIPHPILSEINFNNHPDLAPAIICATAGASIPFSAHGISSLQFKESKRIDALNEGLKLLHFRVQANDNSLSHDGLAHAFYQNSCVNTESDHRICMAFALMSIAQSTIVLTETNSVKKSFPNFWDEAKKIGIVIQ